jgi:hypothetical protein
MKAFQRYKRTRDVAEISLGIIRDHQGDLTIRLEYPGFNTDE